MRIISYALLTLIFVIICILLVFFFFKYQYSPRVIQTTHGPVQSVKYVTVFEQECHGFYGIPYAAPPITGIDPYTGEQVDRRFKVREYFSLRCFLYCILTKKKFQNISLLGTRTT